MHAFSNFQISTIVSRKTKHYISEATKNIEEEIHHKRKLSALFKKLQANNRVVRNPFFKKLA
jgi:hypothetical protein